MNLPTHITFTQDGGQFLLSTTKPYCIGQLWKLKSEQELSLKMEEFRNNGKTVAPVMGYTIFVMFDGCLLSEDDFLEYYLNVSDGAHIIAKKQTELMAAYYSQHIQTKPRAYTRYEIKPFKPYKPLFTHTEIQVL